ncbi:MAG TPA: class I SAM-dependent methyltransferase [Pyrinomonadaceae bacterium]
MTRKSEKELAFLEDLYVATDWGERFAELVDQHVKLPKKGKALYVGSGTGGHALALQAQAGADLKFLGVDESEESLELARAKAVALNEQTEFKHAKSDSLPLADAKFDLVLGNASMLAPARLPGMLAEMARVAKTGATVACWLPTLSSFGEFFSIYWEALMNLGLSDYATEAEVLLTQLPTVSDLEAMAECKGLVKVTSWTTIEEFDYESAQQFLNSPLITDFLMRGWLRSLPDATQTQVAQEIARIIDEERHEAEFSLSVKATLVVGRKGELPVAG